MHRFMSTTDYHSTLVIIDHVWQTYMSMFHLVERVVPWGKHMCGRQAPCWTEDTVGIVRKHTDQVHLCNTNTDLLHLVLPKISNFSHSLLK